MRASEFRAACQILWGGPEGWGAEGAARHLRVSGRNVYYWAADRKAVPAGVAQEIAREMQRRLDDPTDTTPGLAVMRSVGRGTAAA